MTPLPRQALGLSLIGHGRPMIPSGIATLTRRQLTGSSALSPAPVVLAPAPTSGLNLADLRAEVGALDGSGAG